MERKLNTWQFYTSMGAALAFQGKLETIHNEIDSSMSPTVPDCMFVRNLNFVR